MLILDTDHFSALIRGTAAGNLLRNRLAEGSEPFAVTILTVEEGFRGWTAEVAKARKKDTRLKAYARLQIFTQTLASWVVLPWTEESEGVYASLLAQRLGIGTMDLRIASIALAHDATLLSANQRDFGAVPRLRTENWLVNETTP